MVEGGQGLAQGRAAPARREAGRAASVLMPFVQAGGALVMSAAYRVEAMPPAGRALAAGTLIVSNHVRDCDAPLVAYVLSDRRGLHFGQPLPYFASREDLCEPGILARLTPSWPRPLRALLARVPLGWLWPIARVQPIRRVRELTLREALASLAGAGCADAACASVLNARGAREIATRTRAASLERACRATDAALDAHWGLRRLRREARAALAPGFRAAVSAQLETLARHLVEGHCVYFAPEGTTSDDGRFRRVRCGLRAVHRLANAPPLLPVALSYDALARGRVRVVVGVGAPLRNLDTSCERAFAAAIRRSIREARVVTPSHLIAWYIACGPRRFTTAELAAWMRSATAAVERARLVPDRLLSAVPLDMLADERLRWLVRKRVVAREAVGWTSALPSDSTPGWDTANGVVRYLANALADLAPGIDATA